MYVGLPPRVERLSLDRGAPFCQAGGRAILEPATAIPSYPPDAEVALPATPSGCAEAPARTSLSSRRS
jgi:hypothetical protein